MTTAASLPSLDAHVGGSLLLPLPKRPHFEPWLPLSLQGLCCCPPSGGKLENHGKPVYNRKTMEHHGKPWMYLQYYILITTLEQFLVLPGKACLSIHVIVLATRRAPLSKTSQLQQETQVC